MTNILKNIENSFKKATKGKETINNLIYYWGIISYLSCYFIINKILKIPGWEILDISVSILLIIYFVWHIYALKKCSPKKKKLTKEQKKQQRIKNKQDRPKRIMRKLFLQEPISKWNPVLVTIAIDLLAISHFLSYIA